MKKVLVIFILLFTLVGCGTEESKTEVGRASLSWHGGDANFEAIVEVTVLDKVITDVVLRDSSIVDIQPFDKWEDNYEYFLTTFIGMSLEEISNISLSEEPTDYHYTGSTVDGIDIITGASASSRVVIKAVQDACSKF